MAPENTFWVPPRSTTVEDAEPPAEMFSTPPSNIVPESVPLERTFSTPPVLTMPLTAVPPR